MSSAGQNLLHLCPARGQESPGGAALQHPGHSVLPTHWSQAQRWLKKKQERSSQKGPPRGVLSVLGAQFLNQLVQRSQLPPVDEAELLAGEKETQQVKEGGKSVSLGPAPLLFLVEKCSFGATKVLPHIAVHSRSQNRLEKLKKGASAAPSKLIPELQTL